MTRVAFLLIALPLAAFAAQPAHFAGILPCADCPALHMELTLATDAAGAPTTYSQRSTYVDRRGKDLAFISQGRWSVVQEGDATFYRLSDRKTGERQQLKVDGDRALRIVDKAGRDIDSPIAQVLWRKNADANAATVGPGDAGRTLQLAAGQEILVRLP